MNKAKEAKCDIMKFDEAWVWCSLPSSWRSLADRLRKLVLLLALDKPYLHKCIYMYIQPPMVIEINVNVPEALHRGKKKPPRKDCKFCSLLLHPCKHKML